MAKKKNKRNGNYNKETKTTNVQTRPVAQATNTPEPQAGAAFIPLQPKETAPHKSWFQRNPLATGCIIGATALACAMAVGFGIVGANSQQMEVRQAAAEQAHAELVEQVASTHIHNWQADTRLVHHDAVTHDVTHPAVYEDVAVLHTVCNECHQTIDGATDAHYEATGHENYTTNVPVIETKQKSAQWIETITDADAYDELVTETETCSSCGEVRPVAAEPVSEDA